MNVNHTMNYVGLDGTFDLQSSTLDIDDSNQMIFMTSREAVTDMIWAAAVTSKYKLVLSYNDVPWLFDRTNDPNEIINYHNDTSYSSIVHELQEQLLHAMELYDFPLAKQSFLLTKPECIDSPDVFYKGPKRRLRDCQQIKNKRLKWCNTESIANHCPVKCNKCVKDSVGVMWMDGKGKRGCSFVKQGRMEYCSIPSVKMFCLETCTAASTNSTNTNSTTDTVFG